MDEICIRWIDNSLVLLTTEPARERWRHQSIMANLIFVWRILWCILEKCMGARGVLFVRCEGNHLKKVNMVAQFVCSFSPVVGSTNVPVLTAIL